jgi:hypothetical protein
MGEMFRSQQGSREKKKERKEKERRKRRKKKERKKERRREKTKKRHSSTNKALGTLMDLRLPAAFCPMEDCPAARVG